MKARLLLFWVVKIERRTWFDMIDMPIALVFPTHSRLELLLNVLHIEVHAAAEQVQSAGAFVWDRSSFCAF